MVLQPLADRAIYPLVVGGGVAIIVGSVTGGVSYWAVAPPVLLLCGVVVVLLERSRPYAAAWLEPHGDVAADRMHLVANLAVSQLAILTYATALAVRGAAIQPWPHDWPFAAQFVLGLMIIDLGLYWVHRLSHSVPWLWRLHAIHHGPRRVYWMNGQRRHVLHEVCVFRPSRSPIPVEADQRFRPVDHVGAKRRWVLPTWLTSVDRSRTTWSS